MAIELHHLNTHGMMEQACDVLDGVVRLKERIAELESSIDKEKAWSETLSKNGVTMSHEIERLKAENERMKARIAELERMDTEHTLQIAKMNGYISHLEDVLEHHGIVLPKGHEFVMNNPPLPKAPEEGE